VFQANFIELNEIRIFYNVHIIYTMNLFGRKVIKFGVRSI